MYMQNLNLDDLRVIRDALHRAKYTDSEINTAQHAVDVISGEIKYLERTTNYKGRTNELRTTKGARIG